MAGEHTSFPQTLSLAVHELRTPVTVVSGYLRMLLREQGGPLTDKQRKMLEEADRSCGRIGALVSELSELGKLETRELAIAKRPFDFAALVEELAADMHEGSDRGVRLEVRGTTSPIMLNGDRARIGAALKALVHASLRERGEPGTIVAECFVGNGRVVLAVGDAEIVSSIAQAADGEVPPFDEWRGGLGMALPVARRVIEAHGGALWSATGDRPRAGSGLRLPLDGASAAPRD